MRSNIWFLLERGYSRREILEEMQIVYGDECASRSTVYRWVERLRMGGIPSEVLKSRVRMRIQKDRVRMRISSFVFVMVYLLN